jgi:cytochrome c551/c552
MATKADEARYDALQRYGCVCCHDEGLPIGPVDIHHLVDKGNRELSGGNAASIGLCAWHHRGNVPAGHTIASATLAFGPSLRHTSKLFRKIYGTQRELLAKVNSAIQPEESLS